MKDNDTSDSAWSALKKQTRRYKSKLIDPVSLSLSSPLEENIKPPKRTFSSHTFKKIPPNLLLSDSKTSAYSVLPIIHEETQRETRRKFKKDKYRLKALIDLHGMTQHEAHEALLSFVSYHSASNTRTILVITGKGRFSSSGGVLKAALPRWLQTPNFAGIVRCCEPALAMHGGSGAFYLTLKRTTQS
tara:strand:+ start:414 stop:977 length:564 start_codon:yes stop_codon:yes gene_type:complete